MGNYSVECFFVIIAKKKLVFNLIFMIKQPLNSHNDLPTQLNLIINLNAQRIMRFVVERIHY
jgi:hypothetical protein